MKLTETPILPRFGAEISGIDLRQLLTDEARAAIVDAMNRWGVCVFRDTGLDNAGHIAFSRNLGHLETAPVVKDRPRRHPDHAEIFDASNLTPAGEILVDNNMVLHKKGDRLWHTDSSFMEKRSAYSLLLAYETPAEGGQTFFADMRSAYEDLPDDVRHKVDTMEAEHSLWWSRLLAGFPITEEEVDARPKARQPMAMPQPATGRTAIYIGSHALDVVGLPRKEGLELIEYLIDFATQPQYVFGVTWQPGDLAIWDNLTTMHRGGDFDIFNERRDMRRTTVREGAPPEAADDPFTDYFVKSTAPA
ncbi:TauD/TfdA dioxygenase family protein [Sphingomonas baiyangensis]|uniref:TauD/TfdA family dioxygenase n=1 Tax=Sphingomonas baiyangensis TaxID=2572576 RepID=A0A4U1L796_9SPHN|nr:TauD/TfdA family dioxygenase [Sphingomonas baiyangensis]TKD52802.1 TauD/TfdA family dioxygenase [Sphingomonas baiyangensis]